MRAAVDVLIEADEAAYTPHDVVQIVRAQAADVINIKIAKAGGRPLPVQEDRGGRRSRRPGSASSAPPGASASRSRPSCTWPPPPAHIFPAIEPYEHGMLAVGDGNLVYWEPAATRAASRPSWCTAVLAPGALTGNRRLFHQLPTAWCCSIREVVGEARPPRALSTPIWRATLRGTSLTTWRLCGATWEWSDWLVLGGSWGSTLALAYAVRFLGNASRR